MEHLFSFFLVYFLLLDGSRSKKSTSLGFHTIYGWVTYTRFFHLNSFSENRSVRMHVSLLTEIELKNTFSHWIDICSSACTLPLLLLLLLATTCHHIFWMYKKGWYRTLFYSPGLPDGCVYALIVMLCGKYSLDLPLSWQQNKGDDVPNIAKNEQDRFAGAFIGGFRFKSYHKTVTTRWLKDHLQMQDWKLNLKILNTKRCDGSGKQLNI